MGSSFPWGRATNQPSSRTKKAAQNLGGKEVDDVSGGDQFDACARENIHFFHLTRSNRYRYLVIAFWLMQRGSIEIKPCASARRVAMRGIAPIPSTRSCVPHGDHARIAFPTPHLRAYRCGTASILLHLVAQGELHTRCSLIETNRHPIAPSVPALAVWLCCIGTRYPCAPAEADPEQRRP